MVKHVIKNIESSHVDFENECVFTPPENETFETKGSPGLIEFDIFNMTISFYLDSFGGTINVPHIRIHDLLLFKDIIKDNFDNEYEADIELDVKNITIQYCAEGMYVVAEGKATGYKELDYNII
jgi:hypothetical protein